MDRQGSLDHPAWPLRAALLAAGGAAFGLAVERLIGGMHSPTWTDDPFRVAAAAFMVVSGTVFAFSLERLRWRWSAAFAAVAGLIAAFVVWWNGSPNGWGAGEGWQFFSGILAVAIAVPLFQSFRDTGRHRPDTEAVHGHVWTNAILWFAAWAFVGAVFLLTLLLSELFHLIGIDFLRDLLDDGWFTTMLACGAFGGAVGLLRDRDQVLGTLQRVGRAILSVLAPVLALGLAVFVLALPFTGLQPLWEQTQATTPILLTCILGAVILANATIGNAAVEEARSAALRWSAIALVLVMAPLALVAAISTGKRIGQYGFTPDRLWAAVFVLTSAAFALAYLHALVRGRAAWPEALRRANLGLAASLCLLALFLALPILSFSSISARDQLGRLEAGRVAPDGFDWAAMRFDFGPSGRRALERLAESSNLVVRQRAREALGARSRWAIASPEPHAPQPTRPPPIRVAVDGGHALPPALADLVARTYQCHDAPCRLVFVEPKRAVVLRANCGSCEPYMFDARGDGTWIQRQPAGQTRHTLAERHRPESELPDSANGRVEVRTVAKKQLFVDGKPVGEAFD
jgi:hypothetical protein